MRRTLAGPGSSTGNYKATTDPGKALPSGQKTGEYRRIGVASGPASTQANYTPTLDPGIAAPISGSQNVGRFCPNCGKQNLVGGAFCSNCGSRF